MKNDEELSPEEKEKIDQVLSQSACLTVAYELKEEFRKISETSSTVKSGLRQMKKWLAQAQILYDNKKPSRNHLNDLLVHLIWLRTQGDISHYLKEINYLRGLLQNFTSCPIFHLCRHNPSVEPSNLDAKAAYWVLLSLCPSGKALCSPLKNRRRGFFELESHIWLIL